MNSTQTTQVNKPADGEDRLLTDVFRVGGVELCGDTTDPTVTQTLKALYDLQERDTIFTPEDEDIYNLLGNGIIMSKYVRVMAGELRGVGVVNSKEDTIYYKDDKGGVHKQALPNKEVESEPFCYDLAKLLDTVGASSVYRRISSKDGNNPMVVFSNKVYHLSPKVLGVCSDFAGCMIVSLNLGERKPAIAYCSCAEN